jgi:hypothetical protein
MSEKRYTPRGQTWKPCPACKQEILHDIDDICFDCRRKIDAADAIIEREKKRDDVEEYSVPYPSSCPRYWTRASNLAKHLEVSRTISLAMGHLLALLANHVDAAWQRAHPYIASKYDRILFRTELRATTGFDNTYRALMTPLAAQIIRELDTAILTTIRQAYEDGLTDGSHLLNQLASGDITVSQLNTATLREGGQA